MKVMLKSFVAGLVLIAGAGATHADNHGIQVVPVELYTCNFHEGKGPGDLDAVIDKWNDWADKARIDDYAAWTLTPYYFGPEQTFDFIWLGAGKNGVALGKAQDLYNAEDAGLRAAFNETIHCDAHVNFASIAYKLPPKDKTPSDTVLTFSDCKMKEGATFSALGAAMKQWAQHQTDAGLDTPMWHWWPAYGGCGEAFDFKWLEAHDNLADLGADYDAYGNGGGYVVRNRLLSHMLSCDSSRAYMAKNRRYAQLR